MERAAVGRVRGRSAPPDYRHDSERRPGTPCPQTLDTRSEPDRLASIGKSSNSGFSLGERVEAAGCMSRMSTSTARRFTSSATVGRDGTLLQRRRSVLLQPLAHLWFTLPKLRDGRPQRSRRSSTSDMMNPIPGQPPDWIERSNHRRACAVSPLRRYQLPRP